MYGTFESQREGSSERVFADSKSFAPSGNSASWYTSFESENSWEVHAENTEFGYTTIFDDSGSDSHSESSGAQSYTPGEEENPTGDYAPHDLSGGNGSGEGGEGLANSEIGERILNGPARDLIKKFTSPDRLANKGHIINLPHFVDPNDTTPKTTDLVARWYFGQSQKGLLVMLAAGEEGNNVGHHSFHFSLLKLFGDGMSEEAFLIGMRFYLSDPRHNGKAIPGGLTHQQVAPLIEEMWNRFRVKIGAAEPIIDNKGSITGYKKLREVTGEQMLEFLQKYLLQGVDPATGDTKRFADVRKFNEYYLDQAAKHFKELGLQYDDPRKWKAGDIPKLKDQGRGYVVGRMGKDNYAKYRGRWKILAAFGAFLSGMGADAALAAAGALTEDSAEALAKAIAALERGDLQEADRWFGNSPDLGEEPTPGSFLAHIDDKITSSEGAEQRILLGLRALWTEHWGKLIEAFRQSQNAQAGGGGPGYPPEFYYGGRMPAPPSQQIDPETMLQTLSWIRFLVFYTMSPLSYKLGLLFGSSGQEMPPPPNQED
jgi:hypothetical protein